MRWKKIHRIAISGSRNFAEKDLVTAWLCKYLRRNFDSSTGFEDVLIITGGGIGVDEYVARWCMRNGVKHLAVNARWLELSRPAGPRRNRHIISLCNEFYAFWDGKSPGTKHAIKVAKQKKKHIRTFSVKKLREHLHVKPPVEIKLPSHTKTSDAHRVRELVENADLTDLFAHRPKKKRKYKWMK